MGQLDVEYHLFFFINKTPMQWQLATNSEIDDADHSV